MSKIIMIVLMFALIVLIHELGHFLAARFFKVRVNEFAIGMGPKLFGIKRGDTLYSIRALPLGGFCAIEGEAGDSYAEDSMMSKKPWQKFIIFAAGAIMNMLLAWVIFSSIIGYTGYTNNVVSTVEPNSAAAQSGLEVGDEILSVNGIKTKDFQDILSVIGSSKEAHTFQVKNTQNEIKTLVIEPKPNEAGQYKYGFGGSKAKASIGRIILGGLEMSINAFVEIIKAFGQLITGKVPMNELAGIVGVVQISSEAWDQGMQYSLMMAIMSVLNLAGFLSANLAVFNLLPIPALDGGRIIFTLIEMIRRKPIDPEKEGMVHFVGFVFLMILMVFVLYNDIVRIF